METVFTPVSGLLGGVLIGLASIILMAGNGRIAGISGLVSKLLPPFRDRFAVPQSAMFVIGLLMALPVYKLLTGTVPVHVVTDSTPLLIGAGLLVGYGAARGSGCTSGHGVCGISRLSARSIVATGTFMATGVVAVFLLRHVFGG
jgi:uncharacterized membrane protein YedE/YeeE